MRVVDEQSSAGRMRLTHLSFEDFLEALGLQLYDHDPKQEQPSQGGGEKQQPKPVAAPAALTMNLKSELLNDLPTPASGLIWE